MKKLSVSSIIFLIVFIVSTELITYYCTHNINSNVVMMITIMIYGVLTIYLITLIFELYERFQEFLEKRNNK